jgi:hypothetical protein
MTQYFIPATNYDQAFYLMLSELFNPENAMNLDYRILSTVAILLFSSLIFFVLACKRFLRGKTLTASIQTLSALFLCLAGLLSLSIAINLYSYNRLGFEQPIAKLEFKQLEEQRFQVSISYQSDNKVDTYAINGDEWQIDARIIKWHGWAQILGLNAQYRLERISGRYSDIDEERGKTRTIYALGPKNEIDYWRLINDYKKWLPWVDAYYGSATYLPMTNNALYSLSLTQSGLIARPLDAKTEAETKLW